MAFPLTLAIALVAVMAAGLVTLRRRKEATSSPGMERTMTASQSHSTAFASQLGGRSVENHAYTDLPWNLMVRDVSQFFRLAWAVPYILFPTRPTDSGDLDELAWTPANLFCVAVHLLLVLLQTAFVLLLPLALLFPIWMVALAVSAFFALNGLLCLLLNGKGIDYHSDPKYAAALPEHAREQWIFLNGVAVGDHWMKNNLNRLALTFRRPIRGIHNKTSGVLFDVVECMVQRNFGYATTDVRRCYSIIKDILYNEDYDRVVFILHSQGGIEGGLVLDWLLQEVPQSLLCRLEVYTFGNAANHFNNPHRHQHDTRRPPSTPPPQPRLPPAAVARAPPTLVTEASAPHPSTLSDRVIGHIEHYAHTFDFVALWGVLHFTSTAPGSATMPRFIGRVFARASDRGGHQFCQHYLDGMFPLERDSEGRPLLRCADQNDFMESEIVVGREGDESADVDAAYRGSWVAALDGLGDGSERIEVKEVGVKIHGGSPIVSRKGTMKETALKVKDLSRLWQYRNGRVPDDRPRHPNKDADAAIIRGHTM